MKTIPGFGVGEIALGRIGKKKVFQVSTYEIENGDLVLKKKEVFDDPPNSSHGKRIE